MTRDAERRVPDPAPGGATPAFEVLPGDPDSVVVLHVPHASRAIPAAVRSGIVLHGGALERELDAITDARTDEIAPRAADLAGRRPWVFVNRLSRLVVDPERFPDDSEEMNAVGMGVVYDRTTQQDVLRRPTPEGRRSLVATYFDPYAAALAGLVRGRLEAAGRVTILDVHSYPRVALPYELHGDGPRPQVCLGTDPFHTPTALRSAATAAFAGVVGEREVGLDSPFAGCYVPRDQHGVDRDVAGLMLEMRRDVVDARPDELAAALGTLVDAVEG